MKVALVLSCLFLSMAAFAKARVVLLKGQATFGGKELKSTSVLKGKGEISLGDKSYLKLLLEDSKVVVVLGANTKSIIDFSKKETLPEVSLVKGVARWITGAGNTRKGGGIVTKNAVMGVRGTDFYTSYNPLLGETEIICFDGQVNLANRLDPENSSLVGKNQWGGIGGRFGERVSRILDLSPELISEIDKGLPKE